MGRIQHCKKIKQRVDAAHRRTVGDSNATRLQKVWIFGKSRQLNRPICRRNRKQTYSTCATDFLTRIFRQIIKNRSCKTGIHLRVLVPVLHPHDFIF